MKIPLLTLLVMVVAVPTALGGTVTLEAADTGSYMDPGWHSPSNVNYITGELDEYLYRSFFVFDLSSVTDPIVAATLNIFTYWATGPETLTLFDVTTPIVSITDGTAGVAGYTDLGDGTVYGSLLVTTDNTTASWTLNASGISALDAASGLFAFGGAITSFDSSGEEYLFGWSGTHPSNQLILTTVPEPGTWALFGLGGVFLARAVQRRRRKH